MSSSCFLERNHLFLRDPRGGVEDVAAMAAAGFGAIFCNIGDHPKDTWATIRDRARAAGVVCGPWLRTANSHGGFDFDRFHNLIRCADEWGSPLIVNAESELKGTGPDLTRYIDDALGTRDGALSMEAWPFDNVEWWPLADRPILPQLFKSDVSFEEESLRKLWQDYGIRCVVHTFGTYGGTTPDDYDRLAPFGLYTADDCGGDYASWRARGTVEPCSSSPPTPEPPTPEDPTMVIGSQDGVTATFNRLRDLDPGGTILVKQGGKWPALETLSTVPLDKWKAYDKGERTLSILVATHDSQEV